MQEHALITTRLVGDLPFANTTADTADTANDVSLPKLAYSLALIDENTVSCVLVRMHMNHSPARP